jgi:hypothetical protein
VGDVTRSIKALVKGIKEKFRVKIEMSFMQKEIAAPPTPPDCAVATAITGGRGFAEEPKTIGIGGGTVEVRRRGSHAWCGPRSTSRRTGLTNTRVSTAERRQGITHVGPGGKS